MMTNLSSFMSKEMMEKARNRYTDDTEYSDLDKASNELARRLHEEAVENCEAIESDWGDRNHRGFMYNEARAMLENVSEEDLAIVRAKYHINYIPKKVQ